MEKVRYEDIIKKTSLKKFLKNGEKLSGEKVEFDEEFKKSIERCQREQERILRSKWIDRRDLETVINI